MEDSKLTKVVRRMLADGIHQDLVAAFALASLEDKNAADSMLDYYEAASAAERISAYNRLQKLTGYTNVIIN